MRETIVDLDLDLIEEKDATVVHACVPQICENDTTTTTAMVFAAVMNVLMFKNRKV